MQIKQEILDYTMQLLSIFQPDTLTGEYDGLTGFVQLTFVGDTETYTQAFSYNGVEYNKFREIVIGAAGRCVAAHNTKHAAAVFAAERQPFIESVTE